MARYFADAGHKVHVIYAVGTGFPEDYIADTGGITCHPVDAGRLLRWLAPTSGNNRRFRLLRSVLRNLLFPDPFIVLNRQYSRRLDSLLRSGFRPDWIISSALPFSLHSIAKGLKRRSGGRWVADNRDLWATSTYRRRPSLLRAIDIAYERRVLRDADLVTAIGQRMARDLQLLLTEPARVSAIRNGADLREDTPSIRHMPPQGPMHFVYTGILYGGLRDVSPLLAAIRTRSVPAVVDFYRSEPEVVAGYRAEHPSVDIRLHDGVTKTRIKEIQREADFLVVALGTSEFEKGVLTGKFFEYIESRRPIIALCDPDSELAGIVRDHDLGIATRDINAICSFIEEQGQKGVPDLPAPRESLSRRYQLRLLESRMKAFSDEA